MDIKLALIICSKRMTWDRVAQAAVRCGLNPMYCGTLEEARALLAQGDFRVILSENVLPDGDFRMAMRAASTFAPYAPFIVLSETSDWMAYLKALAAGVFDYILCPTSVIESEIILRSALAEAALELRTARAAA